jgi:hypothetical protein
LLAQSNVLHRACFAQMVVLRGMGAWEGQCYEAEVVDVRRFECIAS